MAPKDKKKNKEVLKNPKGTRDWSGDDVRLLRRITGVIAKIFEDFGADELDTPVFERREVLQGNYGEDQKLIYDLETAGESGGGTKEPLSLRYDLTVPFARWLAMNPNITKYKRWAIQKVYRRDQPAIAKGRMREFYQCDIDLAGATGPMINDSEVIALIAEVFEALEWNGRYTIKLNDRRILDGLFEVCGVPEDKIRTISSSIDKLDKMPWEAVREEMVGSKGLEAEVADNIQKYVTRKGGKDLLEDLQKDEALMNNSKAKKGIEEMGILMNYMAVDGVLDKISFDLSLARGLDYYTGVIYEVVTEGSAPAVAPVATPDPAPPMAPVAATESSATNTPNATNGTQNGIPRREKKQIAEDEDRSDDPSIGIGSVAAGGRYDNLVERFRPNANMPCVGVSFGIDRIFSITKARIAKGEKFSYFPRQGKDVFVMAFGGGGFSGMVEERKKIARTLQRAGFKTEFTPKDKPKPQAQFKDAEEAGAPVAVILGEEEQARGEVRVKRMGLAEGDPQKEGVLVKVEDVVSKVRDLLDKIEK